MTTLTGMPAVTDLSPAERSLPSRMFTAALEASTYVAPETHRAAWTFACNTGDLALQARLAARLDAPTDLLARFAAIEAAPVRIAFLARADLSTELGLSVLATESRPRVLRDAARQSHWAPALHDAIARVFLQRPSLKLATALAEQDARTMPPHLAEAIIARYDQVSPGQLIPEEIHGAAWALGRDRAEDLLTRVTHPQVMAALMPFDVDDDLVIDAVNRAREQMERRRDENNWRRSTSSKAAREDLEVAQEQCRDLAAQALRGRRDNTPVLLALGPLLRTLPESYAAPLREATRRVARPRRPMSWGHRGAVPGWVVPAEQLPQPGGNPASDAPRLRLAQLASSSSPEIVAVVIRRVIDSAPRVRVPSQWDTTLAALLVNPNVPADARAELVGLVRDAGVHGPDVADVDVIGRFPTDTDAHDLWMRLFPDRVLARHGWAPFGGVEQAAASISQWVSEPGPAGVGVAVRAGLAAGVPAEHLGTLPASVIPFALTGAGASCPVVAQALVERVSSGLGNEPGAWAMLYALLGEFTGTVDELLTTCHAAAA